MDYIIGAALLCAVFLPAYSSESITHDFNPDISIISLSRLAKLIGYHQACTHTSLSLPPLSSVLFKNICVLPPEVQQRIALNSLVYALYQQLYVRSFKKAKTLITCKDTQTLVFACPINHDTIAITSNSAPVEIWSINNHKKLFTSINSSTHAIAYASPLIVSPAEQIGNLNLIQVQETTFVDRESVSTPHTELITLLLTCSDKLISGGRNGRFCIHDAKSNFATEATINVHTDQILGGTQVSEYCFMLSDTVNMISEWDVRSAQHSFITETPFTAYALKPISEYEIIIGGHHNSLFFLDRRNPKKPCNSVFSSENIIFDLGLLHDKTIVYAGKKLCLAGLERDKFTIHHSITHPDSIYSLTTTQDDTIVCTDQATRVWYAKPTGYPYHTQQPPTLETLLMASALTNTE